MINVCQLKACQRRDRLTYRIKAHLAPAALCAVFLIAAGADSIVDAIFNLF